MNSEQIVLLNAAHEAIGSAEKLSSHHANTPLHLAFSCYIFNEVGDFLLTQRAATKKVWPGVWTNSVCGHPAPGEPFIKAILRRADYEHGITTLGNIQSVLPDYSYRTPPYHGIIENEFCPVFLATMSSDFTPNSDEVQDFRWVSWSRLKQDIASEPDKFSFWLKDQLPLLDRAPNFQHLLHQPPQH